MKSSSGTFPIKSSSQKSRSSESRENNQPMEIDELRRKPNGDGHTIHRYIRGKLLGKGGFAKVYLCTSLDTNRTYAVKIVPKANLVKTRARQKVRSFVCPRRIFPLGARKLEENLIILFSMLTLLVIPLSILTLLLFAVTGRN